MSGFDDVKFGWAGKEYVIPAHKVLGAIARVEDVVTLQELQRNGVKETIPLAKLAMAYGVLLRYAGAQVTDMEIYNGMFGVGKDAQAIVIVEAITNLVVLMIPPDAQKKIGASLDGLGKTKVAAPSSAKTTKSLKKPSK